MKIHSVIQAIRNGIGYATEDRKRDGLALGLDIKYNTNMAHLPQITRFGFVDDKAGLENAEKYVQLLHTKTPSVHQLCRNLSGGNQQKVVLAKWLCNDVKVLIVDEPTRGIDVGAKYEVYELFNQLSDYYDFIGAAGDPGNERPDSGNPSGGNQRRAGRKDRHSGADSVSGGRIQQAGGQTGPHLIA